MKFMNFKFFTPEIEFFGDTKIKFEYSGKIAYLVDQTITRGTIIFHRASHTFNANDLHYFDKQIITALDQEYHQRPTHWRILSLIWAINMTVASRYTSNSATLLSTNLKSYLDDRNQHQSQHEKKFHSQNIIISSRNSSSGARRQFMKAR